VNLGLPAPPTSARTKRTHSKQDHPNPFALPDKAPYGTGTGTGAPARRGDEAKDTSGLKPLRNPELDAAPPRGGAGRSGGRLVVSRRRAAGGGLFLPPPCAALRTRQNSCCCCRPFVRGEGGAGENPIRDLFWGVGSQGPGG